MKTLRIVSTIALILLTITVIIFAQIQGNNAREALEKAEQIASEARKEAETQREYATIAAADARRAESRAHQLQNALDQCQNK